MGGGGGAQKKKKEKLRASEETSEGRWRGEEHGVRGGGRVGEGWKGARVESCPRDDGAAASL